MKATSLRHKRLKNKPDVHENKRMDPQKKCQQKRFLPLQNLNRQHDLPMFALTMSVREGVACNL